MDENNNDALDDANDNIEDANDNINDAKDNVEDAAENVEDTAENVEQEAKSTADEFKEGWNEATKSGENKKMMAGLLAIFLGGFGIHKFILGYNKEGIILLGILLVSFPLMCVVIGAFTMYIPIIIGLIEGIIYLTKSDEEFYNTYQVGKKPWF